jgi:hypothetical protein
MTMLAQIERRLQEYAQQIKLGNVVNLKTVKAPAAETDVVMIGVPVPRKIHAKMVLVAKERNTSLKRLVVEVLEHVYSD